MTMENAGRLINRFFFTWNDGFKMTAANNFYTKSHRCKSN